MEKAMRTQEAFNEIVILWKEDKTMEAAKLCVENDFLLEDLFFRQDNAEGEVFDNDREIGRLIELATELRSEYVLKELRAFADYFADMYEANDGEYFGDDTVAEYDDFLKKLDGEE